MNKVRTIFNLGSGDYSQDLSRDTEDVFVEQKDENGHTILVKTGTTSVVDKIQEWKNESEIYTKLDHYLNGDINALNRKPVDNYGDATILPKNIHEMSKIVDKARDDFDRFPQELKEQLGVHDYQDLMALKDSMINEVIKSYVEAKTPKKEVVKDE